MKKYSFALGLALIAGLALAGETGRTAVKSGPQVGEELAGPFHPLNINGKKAGEKNCLYCENGVNPVVMIFARDTSPALNKLLTRLETCCETNKNAKLGSFAVFCSNAEGLETKLKKAAKDNNLDRVVLSIDNPAGPDKYNVNKDADITVVLYVNRTAKANFAFRKGQMKETDVDAIMKAVPKILSN
jgi:hypothetical protein